MFSVVILTLNEEENLPSCIESIAGCDDVVVLDSGSTDRTVEIAKRAGARVVQHPFADFAAQRNFAHTDIAFKHPWVFHLDADEQMTRELHAECAAIGTLDPTRYDGYFVAPKMMFHGRWIPHCTDFPAYQARFAHVQRFRFVQVGHGQREAPELRLGKLHASYLHNLSSQTDDEITEKHRRYARQEAAEFLSARSAEPLRRRLFSGDPLIRRRAAKELSHRLPAKPVLRFIYQYLWRRGFLDGRPGLAYCVLLARYEHWIAQEIRRRRINAS